ncbi:MAG: hypothetical protein LBG62_04600 [Candidatus Methanoplasma sp.]|jgi:hypothetical protein|nr:hypothetical protein [Candidatus Methanoplasma sp.]
MAGRPILITIIALITLIEGAVVLVSGSLLTASSSNGFVNDVLDTLDLATILKDISDIVGASMVVIGIVLLVAGLGLLMGWKFSWYLATVLYFVTLIAGMFYVAVALVDGEYVGLSGILPTLIAILLIYYMFRPKVKEFYKVG